MLIPKKNYAFTINETIIVLYFNSLNKSCYNTKMIGVNNLSIFKENMITVIAIVIAIIVGLILQYQYQFPPLVSAVVAIFLGLFIGFIVFLIQVIVTKNKKNSTFCRVFKSAVFIQVNIILLLLFLYIVKISFALEVIFIKSLGLMFF